MGLVECILIATAILGLLFTNKLTHTADKRYNIKFICCVVVIVLTPQKLELAFNIPLLISLFFTIIGLYIIKLIGDKISK